MKLNSFLLKKGGGERLFDIDQKKGRLFDIRQNILLAPMKNWIKNKKKVYQ
jgi:hypothetical protein